MRKLLMVLLFLSVTVLPLQAATDVLVTWEKPTHTSDGRCLGDDELQGYIIHYGSASGEYTQMVDIPIEDAICEDTGEAPDACGDIVICTHSIRGLSVGTWYTAITAYNVHGTDTLESGYSAECEKSVSPSTPGIIIQRCSSR